MGIFAKNSSMNKKNKTKRKKRIFSKYHSVSRTKRKKTRRRYSYKPVRKNRRKEKLELAKQSPMVFLDENKAKTLVEEQNQDDEELIKIIMDMFNEMGKEKFITQLESTFYRIDLSKELKELEIPVTMFYSSEDRLLDEEAIRKLEIESKNKDHRATCRLPKTTHNLS